MRVKLIHISQPNRRPSTGDLLASSHFAQWVSENIQEGSYVVLFVLFISESNRSSTPETRSGRAQIFNERNQRLDERETMIERRLGELKDREKRLSAREASLEAKLNRYFLRHFSGFRRFWMNLTIASLFANQRLPVRFRIIGQLPSMNCFLFLFDHDGSAGFRKEL